MDTNNKPKCSLNFRTYIFMWGAPNYPLRQVPDTFWSWNLLQWNSLWRYGTWWPHQSLHVTVLYFTFVFYRPKTTFVGLVSKKRCNNSLSLFKGGLLENTWTFRAYRGKDIQQPPHPPSSLSYWDETWAQVTTFP